MNISEMTPMVVFDNRCYLCVRFARTVNFLARGRLAMVGHYSSLGEKLRDEVLDESALDMFWLINKKNAYGGRAALLPLIRSIVSSKRAKLEMGKIDDTCRQECKTVKSVFIRSSSLFSNSKKIVLKSK